MKTYLLTAAIAAALAAPGVAAAQDSGQVGVHYGSLDANGSSSSIDLYGIDLGFSHQMNGGLVLQADGASDRLSVSGSNAGIGFAAVSVGTRNDSYALYGTLGNSSLAFADAITAGVGGQLYLGQATLNGSVVYGDFDGADATDVHADGTYFFNDNLGVSAEAGYIDFSSTSISTYGVGGVWRPTGSPFSIDLGYQNADVDGGPNIDTWRIGFAYNFGTATAREQSQSGASFNGARRFYQDILGAL